MLNPLGRVGLVKGCVKRLYKNFKNKNFENLSDLLGTFIKWRYNKNTVSDITIENNR